MAARLTGTRIARPLVLATAFPLGTYTQSHPGGCTDPGTNADDGEAAIDVEVASSVAPSAAIELISCAGGTVTFGGLIAMQNLVNGPGPYPGVMSISYGVCEAFNGNGGNQAFYNTYQQAAALGISVFGASGDEGPSSCSADFSVGSEYDVASLGISGWTSTPFNVSVGGTDFEDVYNSKWNGGAPLSNYWNASNTAGYGSALSYIPEMPWDDACANVLISQVARGSFTTYGATGTVQHQSLGHDQWLPDCRRGQRRREQLLLGNRAARIRAPTAYPILSARDCPNPRSNRARRWPAVWLSMAAPLTACAIFPMWPCLPPTAFGDTLKRFAGPIRPRPRVERRPAPASTEHLVRIWRNFHRFSHHGGHPVSDQSGDR